MPERSEAREPQAVRDASPGYSVEAEIATAEDVPPGYKRTEVGVISEDWRPFRIGEVSTKVGSGITPTGGSRVYKSSGRPFVRSQNIAWGYLDLNDIAYIDEATHANFAGTEIEGGDVLLNITGASIGRAAIADHRIAGGNVNQHVCIIRPRKDALEPGFLAAFIISSDGQNQIDSFQAGGNRQGLNFHHVRSIRLAIPGVEEQRAIATALSDADALIESFDRLIAKKRAIKQAAMQQLLTGQTRLPGFTGEWETKRLGDIGILYKGQGIRRDNVSDEGVPCIRYGEIYTRYGDCLATPESRVPEAVAETAFPLRCGDILFAGSGETAEEIGMCVAYLGEQPAVAGGDIVVLRPNEGISAYLGRLLNHPTLAQKKARLGQGDAVVHISARNLAEIEVNLPKQEEQTAIATVLSDMDTEIEALDRRRHKARQIKQGMMQQLLTGRVRLVEENREDASYG